MDVIERLLAEPQRFEFFQAVRLLLLWLGEHGVPPQQALDGHLRFANSLSLAFPASEVEALDVEHEVEQEAGAPPRFRLTAAFMGLLGAHGALPNAYTERLLAWQERDDLDALAGRAFLDIFSTRMLALFYGAWKKYRIEHAVAGPEDTFLPLLLALAGFLPGARHDGIADAALARYAGVLRRRPASAAVLGRVLSSHFGVEVAVQEAAGHWDRLARAEQSTLGGDNAALGRAALLGERCWRPDLHVRVRIGPLDRGRFEHFLPQAEGARALCTLLRLFAAPTLAYEIVLVLRREDVGALRLDPGTRRLGVDSYLLGGPSADDRADLRYELRPMPPLPPLPRARTKSP